MVDGEANDGALRSQKKRIRLLLIRDNDNVLTCGNINEKNEKSGKNGQLGYSWDRETGMKKAGPKPRRRARIPIRCRP